MKTKRLLAFLLIAVFVIGMMPLAAMAAEVLVCEEEVHTHDDSCYTLTCGKIEHTHKPGCYSQCTRSVNPDHYQKHGRSWVHKSSGTSCTWSHNDYYYRSCGEEHTHNGIGKRHSCYTFTCDKPEHTHNSECYEDRYPYLVTVKYIFGSITIDTDTTRSGVIVDDGTQGFTIVPNAPSGYELVDDTPVSVTVSKDNLNPVVSFNLTEVENGGEEPNPESPTPTYVPPQILISTPTPTPEPEIEIPPEEIPTTVTEEEPEQEAEDFEDEEIPTDVPETGEASAVLPAILLAALAGAAFVLAAKKSRNNA